MRFLVPLYTTTIFLSACLLFSVQPMVGKFLLPLLGGTTSVWTTAMLFFQILLLLGYLYAHLISKISNVRTQGLIHLTLIWLAAFTLPIAVPTNSQPDSLAPLLWQIGTMTLMAGAPFFILAASAPLLQRWFSRTSHDNAANPYFLYAASNLGSMIALLAYPFVIEPLIGLKMQSMLWLIGFAFLGLFYIACIFMPKFQTLQHQDHEKSPAPSWILRSKWLLLAFIPSSLMLGYTTYITTDIASMPLFWVIPLALYLLSFILAFAKHQIIPLSVTRILHAATFLVFLFELISPIQLQKILLISIHGSLFFFTALMCHQELAHLKPKADRLTEFYLWLSIGGALGGAFNSLLAPLLFKLPYEYFAIILLSLLVRFISGGDIFTQRQRKRETLLDIRPLDLMMFPGIPALALLAFSLGSDALKLFAAVSIAALGFGMQWKKWPFAITMIAVALLFPPIPWSEFKSNLLISRNYYGLLRVENNAGEGVRTLTHGTTSHGAQALDEAHQWLPLTYYHPNTAAGDLFRILNTLDGEQKVAALGLGVGSIACYSRQGREFNFYEIDPNVISISTNPDIFSYLAYCGSPYEIKLGDARTEIAKAPDHFYDLIFVDVFSSDNIPVHVMTQEAVQLYKQKLKKGGLISIHISNRYFDLSPEVGTIARNEGLTPLARFTNGGLIENTILRYHATHYTALTDNPVTIEKLKSLGWDEIPEKDQRPWTDDFANILRALK
jgi:hypothetical protein